MRITLVLTQTNSLLCSSNRRPCAIMSPCKRKHDVTSRLQNVEVFICSYKRKNTVNFRSSFLEEISNCLLSNFAENVKESRLYVCECLKTPQVIAYFRLLWDTSCWGTGTLSWFRCSNSPSLQRRDRKTQTEAVLESTKWVPPWPSTLSCLKPQNNKK